MSTPPSLSASEAKPRVCLGILGRGKVARSLARRWHDVHGLPALLWSRNPGTAESDNQQHGAFEATSLARVLDQLLVYAALPSQGLVALASREPVLRQFGGTLLLAGIDMGIDKVRRAFPAAIVMRAVPSLLEAPSEISFLMLDDDISKKLPASHRAAMQSLGPIDFVENEGALELLMHLGGPLPVVLGQAFDKALDDAIGTRDLDPALSDLAERVFWRAMRAYGAASSALRRARDREVTTKGGVTEAGLRRLGDVAVAVSSLIDVLTDRVRELKK